MASFKVRTVSILNIAKDKLIVLKGSRIDEFQKTNSSYWRSLRFYALHFIAAMDSKWHKRFPVRQVINNCNRF